MPPRLDRDLWVRARTLYKREKGPTLLRGEGTKGEGKERRELRDEEKKGERAKGGEERGN